MVALVVTKFSVTDFLQKALGLCMQHHIKIVTAT